MVLNHATTGDIGGDIGEYRTHENDCNLQSKTQGYTQVLLGLTIGNEAIMIHVHYSDLLRSLSFMTALLD